MGLVAPLADDIELAGARPIGADPFAVVVPAVRERSIAGTALPIGVDALAEVEPVRRGARDACVAFAS